jgi:hypothetical protein
VSENIHKTLTDANELQEKIEKGQRLTSVVIAAIAVLASLGTLFSHHRSISALTAKNQAILVQSQASDKYQKAEAKLVRSQTAQVLILAGVATDAHTKQLLQEVVVKEKESSDESSLQARELELRSDNYDHQSERILKSYETLEIATTFFEVSIVLVSVSTLVRTRAFITVGCTLSAVGLILLVFGFFQGV